MNRNKLVIILSIILSILVLGMFTTPALAQAQDATATVQRGYRTGYSDGFMAGYKDVIDSQAKDLSRHAEYTKADRAYSQEYGTLEDYRDGYQQGFEAGYDQGFEKRSFDANLPTDLKRRAAISSEPQSQNASTTTSPAQNTSAATTDSPSTSPETSSATVAQRTGDAVIIIPRDTEMVLELQDDLSTRQTREGTRFTAKVTAPSEIAGATVEGRVSKIVKPGRLRQRSEISLSFDRIVLGDNRWSNMSAVLTEVIAVKGDNVHRVDSEGTAIGQSSLKQDAIRVGAPTGAGILIGGIAGGPVGAAVGAGVGAAFGVGAVVVQRGKHIRLNTNQQLRVKTAYETQIR
jgi:hypothetical protein